MPYDRRSFVRLAATAVASGVAMGPNVVRATTAPPGTTTPPTTRPPTTTRPTTTAAPTTTSPPPPAYPLLGLPIANPAEWQPRPALIVKIDNVSAKPQSGLNEADLVFEEIVEGRATRFAAVFNSRDADPVGPIRSGRTQDVTLFQSYNDPVFAFSGGNAGVNAALAATGWTILSQGNGMFRDSRFHGTPHNLYARTTELYAQAGDSGLAVPQFKYGQTAGTPAQGCNLAIGGVRASWAWDATEGMYLRAEGGSPHPTTNGQVATRNVVVLFMPYAGSWVDSRSPEAQSVGNGRAVIYRNAQKIEGNWSRDDANLPFTLTTANGEPLLLSAGRSFIELCDVATDSVTDVTA
jgi:hypothetical protein